MWNVDKLTDAIEFLEDGVGEESEKIYWKKKMPLICSGVIKISIQQKKSSSEDKENEQAHGNSSKISARKPHQGML